MHVKSSSKSSSPSDVTAQHINYVNTAAGLGEHATYNYTL